MKCNKNNQVSENAMNTVCGGWKRFMESAGAFGALAKGAEMGLLLK